MLLIAGPPASGKTTFCLDRLRETIRYGDSTARLLVPTTTMAEHLRNQLVREGFVFSPAVISTFAKFVQPFTGAMTVASTGALQLIVGDLLQRLSLESYIRVREFAGFRRALVGAIEELASAGGTSELLERSGANADFALLFRHVLSELKQRDWHLRSALLGRAAERIAQEGAGPVRTVWMTGFFSFTPLELEVIRALSAHVNLTVTLSEWSGAEPAFRTLRGFANEERRYERTAPDAARVVVKAPTLDQEASDLARRILVEVEQGRQFRDIGVLLRSADPYAGALRTALDRFGIPARFYFGSPLPSNPTAGYLVAVVEAMLQGWEHEAALSALRMPGSPLEQTAIADHFDHAVREALPNSGLEALREQVPLQPYFDYLQQMTAWSPQTLLPREWAARFLTLRRLVAPPLADTPYGHSDSLLWREQALAIKAFEECVEETGNTLTTARPIRCLDFFEALKTVLAAQTLRNIDHRRNVVHIIDAFEARQWKLPVVFVPGMLEKQFPRYHPESPVVPDAVRLSLQAMGVPLRTSWERQGDERFLFDLALTRATDKVVLSYPELNAKGDLNLPSFFLEHAKPYVEERSVETRPAPIRKFQRVAFGSIYDEALRLHLASRHTSFSATRIESFLQCPYQFFAARTLKLKTPPEAPEDRLNVMVQGNIAHAALERCYAHQVPIETAFESAFLEACAAERIPDGYRTEAVRLELLHNVKLLYEQGNLGPGVEYEKLFEIEIEGLKLTGKIDRIEVDESGRAAIIDYKYKRKERVKDIAKEWQRGGLVQAGLYVLGARSLKHDPARVSYVGFKRDVHQIHWHGDEVATLAREAIERVIQAVQGIREGRIEPLALDEDKCRYCDYAMACRKESFGMEKARQAGSSA